MITTWQVEEGISPFKSEMTILIKSSNLYVNKVRTRRELKVELRASKVPWKCKKILKNELINVNTANANINLNVNHWPKANITINVFSSIWYYSKAYFRPVCWHEKSGHTKCFLYTCTIMALCILCYFSSSYLLGVITTWYLYAGW